MDRLRKRSEFLVVADKGVRLNRRGFVLQARRDREAAARPPRFGFTVTKKMGNAVVRNRIRRRLREAVRLTAPLHAAPATDYVLVGRRAALEMPFVRLVAELAEGLEASRRQDRDAGAKHHRSERADG
jgi:ribonuclease P protein component